jgi:hypothetical protein
MWKADGHKSRAPLFKQLQDLLTLIWVMMTAGVGYLKRLQCQPTLPPGSKGYLAMIP